MQKSLRPKIPGKRVHCLGGTVFPQSVDHFPLNKGRTSNQLVLDLSFNNRDEYPVIFQDKGKERRKDPGMVVPYKRRKFWLEIILGHGISDFAEMVFGRNHHSAYV